MTTLLTHDVLDQCREALAASDIADPGAVVKGVVDDVPDGELRDALRCALTALVPVLTAHERTCIRAAARRPLGSTRWQRAADGYNSALLRMRLPTGDGHIFLGDATVEQVRYQETRRRDHAAATLAVADWFGSVAEAMVAHGAERFADLPPEVIAALEAAA